VRPVRMLIVDDQLPFQRGAGEVIQRSHRRGPCGGATCSVTKSLFVWSTPTAAAVSPHRCDWARCAGQSRTHPWLTWRILR
jgi:hypothetical protein